MSAADSMCQLALWTSESNSHQTSEKEGAIAPPSSPRSYSLLPQPINNSAQNSPKTLEGGEEPGAPQNSPRVTHDSLTEISEHFYDEEYCPSDPGYGDCQEDSELESEPSDSDYESGPDYERFYDDLCCDQPDHARSGITFLDYVVFPPSVPIPVSEPIAADSTSSDHWLAWTRVDEEIENYTSDYDEDEYRPSDLGYSQEIVEMGKSPEFLKTKILQEFRADRVYSLSTTLARKIRTGILTHNGAPEELYDSDDSDYSDDSDDCRREVLFGEFFP